MNSEEIVHRIQEQLKERLVKFDDLVNMHVISKKEIVTIYIKGSRNKRRADKELISSLKKQMAHNGMRLETKKKNNRLDNPSIEEERSLRARYKAQVNNEREARRAIKSYMRSYQNRVHTSRDQVSIVQSELEFREEELKKLKEQYLECK